MKGSVRRILVSAVLLSSLATTAGAATYDLSGKWLAVGTRIAQWEPGVVSPSSSHWDVTQGAGTLSAVVNGVSGTGTIDENTGVFHIDMPPVGLHPCSQYIDGTVASDGESFSVTRVNCSCAVFSCMTTTATEVGTRCGNGEPDDGEQCDDGNGNAGDCCSPTCTFEAAGSSCTSDDNICTDDTCDSTGTCQHNANSAACAESTGCATGTCGAGSCVLSGSAPAGTPCDVDANVCTSDACDGSGSCAAGAPLDCSPCGICDTQAGCVLEGTSSCVTDVWSAELSVGLRGTNPRLKAQIVDGITDADLGDPTTTASYTLCLFERDGDNPRRLIMQATVPAGGTCGDDPCWTSVPGKYRYKERDSGSGITQVVVEHREDHAGRIVKFRGKGANLGLPATFAEGFATLTPKLVIDDGVTSRCWYHAVPGDKVSSTVFKGEHSGGAATTIAP
jgi:cysteine-rich repeat protein